MNVEHDLRKMVYLFRNEICYYSQKQLLAMCPNQKKYYQNLIYQRTEDLIKLIRQFSNKTDGSSRNLQRQKEFTIEELSTYDGAEGRPAYVAVNGVVYDVTREAAWGGGTHFGLYAGKDLTPQFIGCHQGMLQILEKLPKVGAIK